MILLDTNICIYIINAKPPEVLAAEQIRVNLAAKELAFMVASANMPRLQP